MPLKIVRNDITNMKTDAVVSAADPSMLDNGGADGCIRRAAGPGLADECRALGGCAVGEAKITGGYALCKYIIHTVGPVWRGGGCGEKEKLASCYKSSLELAKSHGCETIAFPLISAGHFGCPKDQALKIAVDTIGGFLLEKDMTVFLTVFERGALNIGKKLFSDITEYIDDNYVEAHADFERVSLSRPLRRCKFSAPSAGLDDALKNIDESFSQMLLRKIDESGMTDAECYKRANIDRKLFSKIKGSVHYKPSKPTALAFAVALKLPLGETENMLMKAGYALSHSSKFDIIVEYFIRNGNYDVFEINEALFAFDQSLLGM